MFEFNLTLQSDKILLRPLNSGDFNAFEKMTNDPSMWIYFTSDLSVKSDLLNWIEDGLRDFESKNRLPFTIIDKSTNNPIGSTSFGNISTRDQRVEIGWTWIGKEFQGTGVNQAIKYLMLTYIFDKLGFERVEVKTDVLNLKARKALIRIGFKEEGVMRSHTLMTHGRRRDTIYYSILKSEWAEIKMKNRWVQPL